MSLRGGSIYLFFSQGYESKRGACEIGKKKGSGIKAPERNFYLLPKLKKSYKVMTAAKSHDIFI